MYTMRDFLGFFVGSAVTAACILLLLPPSPCPCGGGGGVPAYQQLLANLGNATQVLTRPGVEKHDTTHQAGASSAEDELLTDLLRRAAMDDKTIIMTFTNEAWSAPGSLLDLFLQSFRLGVRTAPLLKHLVVVAVDVGAYERCQHVHPLCYHLRGPAGVDYASEQSFMKQNYLDMMWRRNRFQARVLRLGFSFVFTDVDIVWLRDPLLRIPVGADMAMSCDWFYGDNPYDLNKTANGGFVYAKAGPRMVDFYDGWYAARAAYPGTHEQFVFDRVKHALAKRHGVRVQFVDTAYLSGFCELRKDFYRVCTVHGNCLVGLKTKLEKLTEVLDEWKEFRDKAARMGSNTTALTD
ncbi:hypothetical protein QOZ80_6BG0494040 [Eleusine coracana subsp. coracana]|nr:hypothetical protein QOZ80_6BG0494040 [Eleusine coracana subsp. coracana]